MEAIATSFFKVNDTGLFADGKMLLKCRKWEGKKKGKVQGPNDYTPVQCKDNVKMEIALDGS
jgi:hypothetical protein